MTDRHFFFVKPGNRVQDLLNLINPSKTGSYLYWYIISLLVLKSYCQDIKDYLKRQLIISDVDAFNNEKTKKESIIIQNSL